MRRVIRFALGCLVCVDSLCADDANTPLQSIEGTEAGEVRELGGPLRIRMCWCPPGSFLMGTPRSDIDAVLASDGTIPREVIDRLETPASVTVSNGFWLGQTEVTQGVWETVMKTRPWMKYGTQPRVKDGLPEFYRVGADYPVLFISHGVRNDGSLEPDSAMEFCHRLTAQERAAGRLPGGWEYTLPTSAQREYACRAGTKTTYSFGDDVSRLSEYAWWGGVYAWWEGGAVKVGSARNEPYSHVVGTKKPNPWNLHDMHGNAWEWCLDDYVYKLPDGRDSPKGPRVVRGGGWYDTQGACRSAYRSGESPSDRGWHIGFRLALSRSEQQPYIGPSVPANPDQTKTSVPTPDK